MGVPAHRSRRQREGGRLRSPAYWREVAGVLDSVDADSPSDRSVSEPPHIHVEREARRAKFWLA